MAIEYTWKLQARVLASYTSEAGDTFENVINEIHWRCEISKGENMTSIYGSLNLPKPTNAETYVDLLAISDASDEGKKTLILGWAEVLEPGFKQETEDKLASRLVAIIANPSVSNVTIL